MTAEELKEIEAQCNLDPGVYSVEIRLIAAVELRLIAEVRRLEERVAELEQQNEAYHLKLIDPEGRR
jgi:hypothetical protein